MTASLPRRRLGVRIESLPDGSAVLYDPTTRMTYAITASAAQVWEWCDGAHSPAAMVEGLAALYDAPPDVIARDVDALLDRFAEAGLLDRDAGEQA